MSQRFFYNPNIHPYLEYRRRFDTLVSYAVRRGSRSSGRRPIPSKHFFGRLPFGRRPLPILLSSPAFPCRTDRERSGSSLYDHPPL